MNERARDALAERMAKVACNPQWTLRDLIAFALVHLQHERPSHALVTAEFCLRPVAEMILAEYLMNETTEPQGNA